MSNIAAGVAVLALLSGPAVPAFGQDVTLIYRWTKGETIRYRMVQESATTITGVPGMPDLTIDQSSSQVIRTDAEAAAPDGTVTLRQAIESVKIEMRSPMGTMGYDSENPAASDNPVSAMMKTAFSAMIGEPFTLVIAPTGEVQKVDGVSRLAEKMFKDIPQDPMSAGVLESLKGTLSDDAMRTMFMQAFAQFPSKPLKPGESWDTQFTSVNPVMGGLTTAVTSTLKAVEGVGDNRIARVATRVTMKQDRTKPAPPNPMGMSIQIGDSAGDGELVFAAGTGRLLRSTTTLIMPMTMSGTAPDGSQMNMKSNVKTTTTVELVPQKQ